MTITDMHTHLRHPGAIVNLGIQDSPADGFVYSAGLHPWHLEKSTPADWDRIVSLASDPKTVAIGETGLDRVCSTPISLQTEFFLKHIELARQTGKPLIVHCVRATDLLLNIKKDLHEPPAFIVHGFRGKPETALQLEKAGIMVSLGPLFNNATAKAVNIDNLFIETDDTDIDIKEVAARVSMARGESADSIMSKTALNIQRIFNVP